MKKNSTNVIGSRVSERCGTAERVSRTQRGYTSIVKWFVLIYFIWWILTHIYAFFFFNSVKNGHLIYQVFTIGSSVLNKCQIAQWRVVENLGQLIYMAKGTLVSGNVWKGLDNSY